MVVAVLVAVAVLLLGDRLVVAQRRLLVGRRHLPLRALAAVAAVVVRVAVVVVAPGQSVEIGDVMRHCESAFAKWQLPNDVVFVDAIPLTSTGNMDKKVVRANLQDAGYLLPDLRDAG